MGKGDTSGYSKERSMMGNGLRELDMDMEFGRKLIRKTQMG
jgi:hypothetical protein